MFALTVRERRFLSKCKIYAILSPYLAEHNLLTVQPIFMRCFVLIRRSCVLCFTSNFFALFIDRTAVFFNTVLVCKSGLWHSPHSMSCCAVGCLQAAIQPIFMKLCLELEKVVYFALKLLLLHCSQTYQQYFATQSWYASLIFGRFLEITQLQKKLVAMLVTVVTGHFLGLPFSVRVRISLGILQLSTGKQSGRGRG